MTYRYKKAGGFYRETSSIDVIFCFVQDAILENDIWDYEIDFQRFLNENYGPSGIEIRDFLKGNGDFVTADFDYAGWLMEEHDEYYEAWLKEWRKDYAESEADDFAYDLERLSPGDELRQHGVTVLIFEDKDDYVED